MPVSAKTTLLLLLAVLLLSSCGDDLSGPGAGSGFGSPTYQGEIETFRGTLETVRGTGPDDVYAIGDALFHFDGTRWKSVQLPTWRGTFEAGWSPARGELFLTDDRTLYHYSQGRWSWHDPGPMYTRDIWASSATDAYAVGSYGALHYNGIAWREVRLPGDPRMRAIAGTGRAQVVIVGQRGIVLRFDGRDWNSTTIDTNATYTDVALAPSGRTYVLDPYSTVSEITAGTAVPILENGFSRYAWVSLCTDGEVLYAAGPEQDTYDAVIRRYENGTWTTVTVLEGEEIQDVWHAPGGPLFASGWNGFLWRSDAGGGTDRPRPRHPSIQAAWGTDEAAFLIGSAAYRIDRGGWTDLDKEYVTRNPATAIHGRNERDVYAVGDRMILHYDGSKWSWVNGGLDQPLQDVWVGPMDDVVAVSADGSVVEYDGNEWALTPLAGMYDLSAVWGAGDRAFVVGRDGFFARRIDGTWSISHLPDGPDFTDLWGVDKDHLYALTRQASTVYVFNGSEWAPMTTGGVYTHPMAAIWGSSAHNLFTVDGWGTIAHFDGRTWTELPRLLGQSLSAVCELPGGGLIVCGYDGVATYRRR